MRINEPYSVDVFSGLWCKKLGKVRKDEIDFNAALYNCMPDLNNCPVNNSSLNIFPVNFLFRPSPLSAIIAIRDASPELVVTWQFSRVDFLCFLYIVSIVEEIRGAS
jgi:hypothetical protein